MSACHRPAAVLYWRRKEVISVNSSPLNEKECFLVIHSLDELYAFLRKSGSRDRSLSRSAVSQNLSAILSAKTKLRALPANASADFSAPGAQGPLLGRVRNAGCDSFSAYRNAARFAGPRARHRNLSKPATGFSACSLIFLRRLVSKSNRCFRTREICAQQSDQPCCIWHRRSARFGGASLCFAASASRSSLAIMRVNG